MHKFVESLMPRGRGREPMFSMPAPAAVPMDRDTVARAYARLFSTEDGKTVLAHLQGQTFLRMHTPDTPDSHIRFTEGQRALVNTMLRLISIGKAH